MDHESLHSQYLTTRARSRALFGRLAPEAMDMRPIPLRLQFRFYEGHLANFNLRMMLFTKRLASDPNPHYSIVFDRGIDPLDAANADPDKIRAAYPSRGEVREYTEMVEKTVEKAFRDEAPLEILATCVEHEMMHQETLHYMLHQLGHEFKKKPADLRADFGTGSSSANWVEIPPGRAMLGASPGSIPFGWDNEFPGLPVNVPSFRIQSVKVSNGDFLKFVQAEGYYRREYWTDSAWAAVQKGNLDHPQFWFQKNGAWWIRGLFEDHPLPLNWPAWVSHMEAEAYCNFAGAHLPTEAEWQRALDCAGGSPDPVRDNYDWRSWNPVPVSGSGDAPVRQLAGNGWEWTSSRFRGLPGFKPMAQYPNYSIDFFDDHHYIIKGASPLTAAQLVRPSFRNWFQNQYPFAYIGFRCVKDN